MTEDTTRSQTWLVAIDIGKSFHAVLVEAADGRRQHFQMANTRRGLRPPGRVSCAHGSGLCELRSSRLANLHRTLAHRLLQEGFPVVSVSSVAGARYREAMFNSWDKNDPKDATVILHLLKQGIVQHYHDPLLAGDHDLQELAKTYHANHPRSQTARRTVCSITTYPCISRRWVVTGNPRGWNGLWSTSTKFPTPGPAVCALPKEEFVKAAGSVIGRKVNKRAKLEELYALAHQSIALPVSVDSARDRDVSPAARAAPAAGRAAPSPGGAGAYAAQGPSGLPASLLPTWGRRSPGHGDPR